jgi:hypothetical protein
MSVTSQSLKKDLRKYRASEVRVYKLTKEDGSELLEVVDLGKKVRHYFVSDGPSETLPEGFNPESYYGGNGFKRLRLVEEGLVEKEE